MTLNNYILILSIIYIFSCGNGADILSGRGTCYGYPEPTISEYILPYDVGEEYSISQGNCSFFSHKGDTKYAYDFLMPINSEVRASRAGTVIGLRETLVDGNGGTETNYLMIEHSDGTVGLYVHLTENGALVELNDTVSQGDLIAYSGNTGYSTGPHLHFEVRRTRSSAESIPVSFVNTEYAPNGLNESTIYEAENY